MWWGTSRFMGSHTLAGRFRLRIFSSACSLLVLASFVFIELSSFPMEISAAISCSSGSNLGAWKNKKKLERFIASDC